MSSQRSGYGVDRDTYDPQQYGMRNVAGRDGYEVDDGYMLPNPPPWTGNPASAPSASGYGYGQPSTGSQRPNQQYVPQQQRPRRRDDSLSSRSGDEEDYYARTGRDRGGAGGALRKYKSYEHRKYYDDDEESDDDRRGRDKKSGGLVRRSLSRLRTHVQDAMGGDEGEDGSENSEAKKWAATVGGALVGGLAGRQARKDNWVPTAIGALVGGFAARKLETTYYQRKDSKREEENAYEGGRRGSGLRAASRG